MTLSINNLPRIQINFLPTPLVELKRLADVLDGPRIFVKRDDLTGLALGGNKTRKLEFVESCKVIPPCCLEKSCHPIGVMSVTCRLRLELQQALWTNHAHSWQFGPQIAPWLP